MKTANETTTLKAIFNAMDDQNACEWWSVMDIEIPGIAEIIKSNSQDFDAMDRIAQEFFTKHQDDIVIVMWPEHVITPKYNSDAIYHTQF